MHGFPIVRVSVGAHAFLFRRWCEDQERNRLGGPGGVLALFLEMHVITFAVADGTSDPIGNNSRHASAFLCASPGLSAGSVFASNNPIKQGSLSALF